MNEYQPNMNYIEVDGDILPPDAAERWEEPDQIFDHEPYSQQPNPVSQRVAIELDGPPIAITLQERALALRAIAAYYNQASKRRGVEASRHASGFNSRYGPDADDVIEGMAEKESRLLEGVDRALSVLNASAALTQNGEPPESVGYTKRKLREQAAKAFGSKGVYANDRKRIVERAKKLANAVKPSASSGKSTKAPFAKYKDVLSSGGGGESRAA